MRKNILKITSCLLALTLLCSCNSQKVLKTKDLTDKITQTSVVTESDIHEQADFSIFFNNFKSSFTVPGLFEGIIPQGMCYDETTGYFLITGYYEDGVFPSMVMCVDANTGDFISAHPLKTVEGDSYYGHAGGIASSRNTIYITSSGECCTLPVTDLESTPDGEPLQFASRFKLNTLGSFACIHNNILWTGDFIESDDSEREKISDVTTLSSGETFYAFCEGYILEEGLPAVKKVNSDSTGYIPDYMLAIPEQVQGMAFTKTDKIIFSTSYGRKNNSVLYIYDDVLITEKSGTKTIDGKNIDLYACSNELLESKITAPPMAEGLAEHPDGIHIVFESGAAKYRNGNGKFPVDTAFKTTIE